MFGPRRKGSGQNLVAKVIAHKRERCAGGNRDERATNRLHKTGARLYRIRRHGGNGTVHKPFRICRAHTIYRADNKTAAMAKSDPGHDGIRAV
jgi:hypothetical protein